MNETLKILKERRSIRVFKDEQIKDDELQSILEAGLYAPSALNEQSWHFTVIQNSNMLQKFTQVAKAALAKSHIVQLRNMASNDNYRAFYNAPTAIIISGYMNASNPQADTSNATENILIAAKSLGLGTCWIGSMPFIFGNGENEELKKELRIPEGYQPINSIALGYAVSEVSKAPARKENKITIIK
ncbi:nitroreductase family protein [Clostridium sp. CF011]|uniref:nitroreductase family protein n=1 Tax=unclassified Clostridium TaxID=2614128 RepID=UPI001C0CC1EA|nr:MULTISPECIES: nitroreductase family protein [unclassified Clostridium]MBU3092786.1 nitroreductase family protein [Clostridium sp. CF011]MBW9147338.1 nitroreductase family protein [Clostridium sp. CM027]UVE42179.1 nitroreductase family protein [Clostridium sp. CM027]WAG71204.1 nitroreductase family protein [Clostridium sp. CF011]